MITSTTILTAKTYPLLSLLRPLHLLRIYALMAAAMRHIWVTFPTLTIHIAHFRTRDTPKDLKSPRSSSGIARSAVTGPTDLGRSVAWAAATRGAPAAKQKQRIELQSSLAHVRATANVIDHILKPGLQPEQRNHLGGLNRIFWSWGSLLEFGFGSGSFFPHVLLPHVLYLVFTTVVGLRSKPMCQSKESVGSCVDTDLQSRSACRE